MRRHIAALTIAATTIIGAASPAVAHERGDGGGGAVAPAGEPSCFGLRTSHAASAHDLNPSAKAAEIQWWKDNSEFGGLLQPWYGDTVEVREVMAWVRMMCEG